MEALSAEERQALKVAVDKQRKDEAFERSLGRAMRAVGLDFDAYIQLIGRVRDLSRDTKTTLEEAAVALSNEQE